MGQGQSLPDGSQVVIIDEDLYMVASRDSNDSSEPGHTRPLPPPHSRQEVLSELRKLYIPETSSPTNGVLGPACAKRGIEAVDEGPKSDAVHVKDEASTRPAEQNAQTSSADIQDTARKAHDYPPAKKKRRLFANQEAVDFAQKISEQTTRPAQESSSSDTSATETGATTISIIPQPDSGMRNDDGHTYEGGIVPSTKKRGPFIDEDSEDEGYHTYSPSSAETSFNEDDEDGMVTTLAKLHQRSVSSRLGQAGAHVPTPPDSPTLRKLQEEDESAEQSRRLREQKLSGQPPSHVNQENAALSGSFFDDDLVLSEDEVVGVEEQNTRRARSRDEELRADRLSLWSHHKTTSASQNSYHKKRYLPAPPSSDSDDDGVQRDLDVAQSYQTRTPLPKPRIRRINPRTPRYRRFPPRANPYSRRAAEQYCTQGRHLATSPSADQPSSTTAKGSANAEGRLRALTSKTYDGGSPPRTLPSFGRSTSPIRQQNAKFHAIDSDARFSKPSRQLGSLEIKNSHDDVQSQDPNSIFNQSPLGSESGPSTETSDTLPGTSARPQSMLEMMAQKAQQKGRPMTSNIVHNSAPAFGLGQVADIDHDDEDQVREEHERLKEQQKDLNAIEETCMAIANISALGPLTTQEAKEEQELRKFISIVIDGNRSGKERRSRMTAIRGNFDRRLDREVVTPAEGRVQEEYAVLLGEKRIKLLNDLRDPLDDVIHQLRTKRSALVEKRHSKKNKGKSHKKQVRFAESVTDKHTGRFRRDIADGTVVDLDGPTRKIRSRPLGKGDKQIALLREKLALLEAHKRRSPQTEAPPSTTAHSQDSESEVSEEDEGAEYVLGAGRKLSANSAFTASTSFPVDGDKEIDVEQDLDEINRLEDERQQRDRATATPQGSYAPGVIRPIPSQGQRPDAGLIERMKQTMVSRQRKAVPTAGTEVPFDDLAEESDASETSVASRASSSSASTSSSDTEPVIHQFRYTVMGQFAGIETYNPGEEYVFKSFQSLDSANDYIQKVVTSIPAHHQVAAGTYWMLTTECRNGLYEQKLVLGDGVIEAKVWLEREVVEIDLGQVAASKARKAKLEERRPMWVVDWEKTVTTTVTVQPTATADRSTNAPAPTVADEEDEELFGRSPSPPPSAPITTEHVDITRPTPEEIFEFNMFTTAPLANRRAKELYITWYAQYFPENQRPYYGTLKPASGSRYEGMLGQVDNALEEELERLGEWGIGFWEEEVGGEEDGTRFVEKMKVWVRRVGVKGPQN